VARRYSLRASDGDRDDVAERLRTAAAEGRLLVTELEQRLEAAFRARTYGELDALVADLPAPPVPAPPPPARRRPGLPVVAWTTLTLAIVISVLGSAFTSGFTRFHEVVGAGGPSAVHGRPSGLYQAAPAGQLAVVAALVMIVFLVVVCVAFGWLFSQDPDEAAHDTSAKP
jgi:Domain of unknown function (DUF1707)